jgi:hypothetical protein
MLVDQAGTGELCVEAVAKHFSKPSLVVVVAVAARVVLSAHIYHYVQVLEHLGISAAGHQIMTILRLM